MIFNKIIKTLFNTSENNKTGFGKEKFIQTAKTKIFLLKKEAKDLRKKLKDIGGTNLELGKEHLKRGNIADAIMRFRLVLTFNKKNEEAIFFLGRAYQLNNEKEKALECFEKVKTSAKKFHLYQYEINKLKNPDKILRIPHDLMLEKITFMAKNKQEIIEKRFPKKSYNVLKKKVLRHIDAKNPNLSILDLDCSLGRIGEEFAKNEVLKTIKPISPISNFKDELASKTYDDEKIYQDLAVETPNAFCQDTRNRFDVAIVSYYLDFYKKPMELLSTIMMCLKKDAIICCLLSDNNDEEGFSPNQDIFVHSVSSLEKNLKKSKMKILEIKEIPLNSNKKNYLVLFTQ